MKYIKTYETELTDNIIKRSQPEYYLEYYTEEQKKNFLFWYNKIKSALFDNDENLALNILLDWDKECLEKFDLYSLVRNYFEVQKIIGKFNL